jgi:hypothetical protein
MEAICSPGTSVDFERTTRRYIPEDRTLHKYRCENRGSYITQPDEHIQIYNLYGPMKEGVTGGRRKSRSAELHNMKFSPNNVIKSRKMGRVGHVAGMVKEPAPEVRSVAGMSRRR